MAERMVQRSIASQVAPKADSDTILKHPSRKQLLPRYAVIAALFIISSAWCVTAARRLGATYDEPLYLQTGLSFWHGGDGNDVLLLRGTMPLPADLDGFFLRVHELVRGKAWNPQADIAQMLPAARAATLVFWLILLVYSLKLGEQAGGVEGGLMAAAMVAVEPILLGHASLATTDIAVTALVVAPMYHFAAGRGRGWKHRVGIPALLCGLAILSKASAVIFVPLCLLAAEVERLWPAIAKSDSTRPRSISEWVAAFKLQFKPFWRDLREIIGIGLLITILYCGSGWHPQWSFVVWARSLPPHSFAAAPMLWLAGNLRIFNNAVSALVYQFKHSMHAPPTYLLGRVASSFWYYYPLALTIKLSIPVFAIALTVGCLRKDALRNCAIAAAAALLLFSVFMRLQIGIRLVLPLVALFIIGTAAALAEARRELGPGWKSGLLAAEFVVAILWTGAAALRVWPEGICYTNELWGGTTRGDLYLSDSNYDWGQGIPDVEKWQRAHDQKRVALFYYGTDPRMRSRSFFVINPWTFSVANLPELARREGFRYLAAGTTVVYGIFDFAAPLRNLKLVARTPTFLIYDVGPLETHTEK
jgi:hypothetical protein